VSSSPTSPRSSSASNARARSSPARRPDHLAFYMGYCPHRRKGHVSCGTRDGRTLSRRRRLDRHACSSSRTGVWRALDQTLACRPDQARARPKLGRSHSDEARAWRPAFRAKQGAQPSSLVSRDSRFVMRSQRRPKPGVHPELHDRGRLPLTLRDAGAPRVDDGAATPLLLVRGDSADLDRRP
jgi:hypothetical protein